MEEYEDQHKVLENIKDKSTVDFYTEHNQTTDAYFTASPLEYFAREIADIANADIRGLSMSFGKYTFWAERKKEWQKSKLLVQSKNDDRKVILDFENSDESLDFWYPSPDGKKLLYGTSKNGDEQTTIHLKDVVNNKMLDDVIPFAGFTDQGDICWLNGSSFIYPRMNGFEKKGPEDKWLLGTKLYTHKLGDNPQDDNLLFGQDSPDTVMLIPSLSSDYSKVYVAACEDELTHKVSVVDLRTMQIKTIASEEAASFVIKAGRGKVYALTNYKAPRYRLLMCEETDLAYSFDEWDEVLPETENILQSFWIHRSGSIVAKYMHNVSSLLNIYDSYGNQTEIIHLPDLSVVQGVICSPEQHTIHISLSGYLLPPTHYSLSGASTAMKQTWQREPLEGDDQITVTQEWSQSKDGSKIPYFLIHHIDSIGPKPCVIYGYGGFNISIEPAYLSSMRPWILAGGTIAIANLRGGSEFGEEWHTQGSMAYKQNTFDDCIAVGQELINRGVSTMDHLGVMGGSNGGLLVAAVTVQRPDLFRAGAALVPLTDMLEFYKHQVAEFWVHEYGDPRIAEQREWIKKWSPYHYPINPVAAYPALYYETALHDARVSPFHALKMVAKLESKVSSWKGPILLRTMVDTGHQSGNLTKVDLARRTAEYYAFFAKELGLII